MTEYKAQDTDIVFALDIGTRSVVGIVGTPVGDRLKVLGIEMEEHKNRAMMDGQIDNIQQVADLARIVTERLERQLKVHLEKVCVAAAGRALRTQSGTFALEVSDSQPIDAKRPGPSRSFFYTSMRKRGLAHQSGSLATQMWWT